MPPAPAVWFASRSVSLCLAAPQHSITSGHPGAHDGMVADGVVVATIRDQMIRLNKQIVLTATSHRGRKAAMRLSGSIIRMAS